MCFSLNIDAQRLAAGYHTDTENTEIGGIERVFASVLGYLLSGSPLSISLTEYGIYIGVTVNTHKENPLTLVEETLQTS